MYKGYAKVGRIGRRSINRTSQHLSMENPDLEDNEVELSICDEDDYTSLFSLEDTDHLKDEYFQGEIDGASFNDPPLFVDHILKDENFEMLEPLNLILNKHVKGRNDQDGAFGYVFIEYFLESDKKESVQANPIDKNTKGLIPPFFFLSGTKLSTH